MSDPRRMSDAEHLMWRLDEDPHLASTFASVSVLDRPPDVEALRARMDAATWAVPRLRWRVQPAPLHMSPPTWVDDPQFSIDHHVRRIALPEPGTMRQLLDLATLLTSDPLDRTRPLWQFVVVEGLRDGRAALVQKMHHTITDGEGGVRMSLQFLDLERDPPPRPPRDPAAADLEPPPPAPTVAETLRDLVAAGCRVPAGLVRQVRELLADPAAIPAASTAAADAVRGVVAQLGDVERARSPLWTQRSLRRHVEVVRVPLRPTKDAATRLGGTVNTAFVTAAADAASRYHEELGAPVEHLRTTMAISTRTSSAESNAFTLARLLVPTSPMPIAERFRLIHLAVDEARGATATASLPALAGLAAALPTSLVTRLARQQAETVDFATSNVRAAPVPVYLAGAKVLETYPLGPLAGVACNLTLLSYDGSLDIGVHVDAAAVDEPARLAAHLERAFADLARGPARRGGRPVRPARAPAPAS